MRPASIQVQWLLLAGLLAWSGPARAERQVVSLDGLWGFAPDAEDIGLKRGWAAEPPALRSVSIPSCWEENGLATGYDGVGWYYKRLKLGDIRADAIVRLRFAGVSDAADVFVDGQPIGDHEGAYEPFEALVPAAAAGTVALLAVRVDDRRPSGPEAPSEQDFGGIWQPVEMIVTGPSHIRSVSAEVSSDLGTLVCHAEVTVTPQASGCRLECAILDGRGDLVLSRGDAPASSTECVASVPIPAAAPRWSPASPEIVLVRAQLIAPTGESVDEVVRPAAIRYIEVRDGRALLNGRPLFVKAVRYLGRYPTSQARPPSDEFLRRDLAMIRAAGFNALQSWPGPMPDQLSLAADRAGLIPLSALSDRFSGLSLPRVQFGGVPDIAEMAERQAKMELTWPVPSSAATTFARYRDLIGAGLALFPFPVPSETRGSSLANMAANAELRRRLFHEGSLGLQAEWLTRAIDEIRLQPDSAGLIVMSWEDWAGSLGPGVVSVFRQPKPSYQALREALAPQRCIIRLEPRLCRAGEDVSVRLNVVADEPILGRARAVVWAEGPSGEKLPIADGDIDVPPASALEAAFRPPRSGLWRVRADVDMGAAGDLAAHAEALQLDEAEEPDVRTTVGLLVDAPPLRSAFERWGIAASAYDPETAKPSIILVPGAADAPAVGLEARVREARALAERGCVLVFLAQTEPRAFGPTGLRLVDPTGPFRMGMTVLSADGPFDGLGASPLLDRVPGAEALLPTSVLTWPRDPEGADAVRTDRTNLAPHFGPATDMADALPLWGSAMLQERVGAGYALYCQLPVEEHLGHPGSRRLLKNLLALAERLLPTELAPPSARPLESRTAAPAPAGEGLVVQVSDPVGGTMEDLLAAHFQAASPSERTRSPAGQAEPLATGPATTQAAAVVETTFRDSGAETEGRDIVVPLPTALGLPPGQTAVVCILMSVYSPERGVARLTVSYGGPCRVWFDGRPVGRDPNRWAVDLGAGWHELRLNVALPRTAEAGRVLISFAPAATAASPPLGGARATLEAEDQPSLYPERAVTVEPGGITLRHGVEARLTWRLPTMPAGRYDLWIRYRADRPTPVDIEIPGTTLSITASATHTDGPAWAKLGRIVVAPELNLAYGPRPVASPRTTYRAPQMALRHRIGELTIDRFVFTADEWAPEESGSSRSPDQARPGG